MLPIWSPEQVVAASYGCPQPPGHVLKCLLLHVVVQDMETQLLVTSMNGDSISLPGYFRPAKKTVAGCQCSQWWAYTNATGSQIWINGTCINPLNNPNGAWCVYEPDSCTDPTGKGGGSLISTCRRVWLSASGIDRCSACPCWPRTCKTPFNSNNSMLLWRWQKVPVQ